MDGEKGTMRVSLEELIEVLMEDENTTLIKTFHELILLFKVLEELKVRIKMKLKNGIV